MNNLEIFNEIRLKLNNLVEVNKGFKINGINDIEGYEKVKQAKDVLRKEEIELERLAKAERQNALEYQRGIIKLEKDLKEITSPIIEDYKAQIEQVDLAKAREERKILLPDRKKQLEEIEQTLSDNEILDFDEKEWFEFYNKVKLEHLEIKEQERKEKERKEKEEKRIEEAKKEAKEQAIKEERERVKREEDEEAKRLLKDESNKKLEQEAKLKDIKIRNWLKENNYNQHEDKIFSEASKMVLYKKVSELEIN